MISLASGGKKKKKKKKKEDAKGFDTLMAMLANAWGARPELIWLVEICVFRNLFIYLPLKE